MTTDIERQFFETFGIEPKKQCFNEDCIAKDETGYDEKICDDKCVYIDKEYPQITDRILLELICINAKSQDMYQDYYRIRSRDYNNLKIEILGDCMCEREDIKQQVQSLFKER